MSAEGLIGRLARARVATGPELADRTRGALASWLRLAQAERGTEAATDALAEGGAAVELAEAGLAQAARPQGLACAEGCAFCCILSGEDGGTISEAEARRLHAALAPHAGAPDGRAWHPRACPALDPETRACRAYDARPVICRSYVSTDAQACEQVSQGHAVPGPGTLGPYHGYLAALGLSRAALKGARRVSTHALARLAAAAVEGQPLDAALAASRHKPAELEAEIRRSKRDLARIGR